MHRQTLLRERNGSAQRAQRAASDTEAARCNTLGVTPGSTARERRDGSRGRGRRDQHGWPVADRSTVQRDILTHFPTQLTPMVRALLQQHP